MPIVEAAFILAALLAHDETLGGTGCLGLTVRHRLDPRVILEPTLAGVAREAGDVAVAAIFAGVCAAAAPTLVDSTGQAALASNHRAWQGEGDAGNVGEACDGLHARSETEGHAVVAVAVEDLHTTGGDGVLRIEWWRWSWRWRWGRRRWSRWRWWRRWWLWLARATRPAVVAVRAQRAHAVRRVGATVIAHIVEGVGACVRAAVVSGRRRRKQRARAAVVAIGPVIADVVL